MFVSIYEHMLFIFSGKGKFLDCGNNKVFVHVEMNKIKVTKLQVLHV